MPAQKVNALYLPFPVVRDLARFLAFAQALGIRGFSVTIPHKQAILRYLDGCDPLAAEIGAVNTVVGPRGGRLYGYNTDYVGVLRAIERRMPLPSSRVLLFGAGGAARAAAFALARCRRRGCDLRAASRASAQSWRARSAGEVHRAQDAAAANLSTPS